MSDSEQGSRALAALSRGLCPWLVGPFAQLQAARACRRLGHGWLVAGPRGVGKLNLALVMADSLLRGDVGEPPQLSAAEAAVAMAARRMPADHHPDLQLVFPEEDKRTISVEQIREAGRRLGLKSLAGNAKVVVIEPAEAMTASAGNALLKTLEEPTADTYLWLVSHQPGGLSPTIRSRCQTLLVRPPSTEQALEWLRGHARLGRAELDRLLALTGGSPLQLLDAIERELPRLDRELEEKLVLISRNRIDPHAVADEWMKEEATVRLEWLIRRLQLAIRARLAPRASKPFTDSGSDTLHNAWQVLTLRRLFSQLGAAERLREQWGGGINVDLALRALLLGFQPQEAFCE
jgi:DNA polymerase-3 subunit delta'